MSNVVGNYITILEFLDSEPMKMAICKQVGNKDAYFCKQVREYISTRHLSILIKGKTWGYTEIYCQGASLPSYVVIYKRSGVFQIHLPDMKTIEIMIKLFENIK